MAIRWRDAVACADDLRQLKIYTSRLIGQAIENAARNDDPDSRKTIHTWLKQLQRFS